MMLDKMGLEEAEMYVLFAQKNLGEHYEDLKPAQGEHKVAAAEALLEASRIILRRLIQEKIAEAREGGSS